MTHDELLMLIRNKQNHLRHLYKHEAENPEDKCWKHIDELHDALRAVVELHKPDPIPDWVPTEEKLICWCAHIYPCPTIQAIEKELG